MKTLYYDCFSGISGDMNLGALIDLGVDVSFLNDELKKLPVGGYELRVSKAIKKGIEGTKAEVVLHDLHEHKQEKSKADLLNFRVASKYTITNSIIQTDDHHHRTYIDIKTLIEKSSLSPKVKELSIEMFRRIAEAEGKIHGKPIAEVHFHEVGAIDYIVDIVGAAICIDYLKPDNIISTPPQLGGGFVNCEHGTFPVPAPATAEILKGIPSKTGAVNFETTTPTGAAILATLCNSFSEKHEFIIQKIGYGIGHKDFEIPNVLRVMLVDDKTQNTPLWITEESRLIECNIDDMSPERFGYIMEKLFEAGADDVFFEAIGMKKNRPAHKISVLTKPLILDKMLTIIFTETSTLGVRVLPCEKKMMERRSEVVQTHWGPVTFKYGLLNGKDIKAKPEFDDCLRIAKEYDLSFHFVYEELISLKKLNK